MEANFTFSINKFIYLNLLFGEKMHGVGFEPTRTNTLELKTNPLDQLGQPCYVLFSIRKQRFYRDLNPDYQDQNLMS